MGTITETIISNPILQILFCYMDKPIDTEFSHLSYNQWVISCDIFVLLLPFMKYPGWNTKDKV